MNDDVVMVVVVVVELAAAEAVAVAVEVALLLFGGAGGENYLPVFLGAAKSDGC